MRRFYVTVRTATNNRSYYIFASTAGLAHEAAADDQGDWLCYIAVRPA